MVTFCVGNPNVKRKAFHRENDRIVVGIDNDEVVASFEVGKRRYYVVGDVPFADMSVKEYILYQRSLVVKDDLQDASIAMQLKKFGLKIKLDTMLAKLSRVEYRAITFISRLLDTTETVYINFDSLEFNHKNRVSLKKFLHPLARRYNVYVAVTDSRFIPRGAGVLHYTTETVEFINKNVKSRVVAKHIADRTIRQNGLLVDLPPIKCVVSCDATTAIG